MMNKASKAARELVRNRWAKTTPEERSANAVGILRRKPTNCPKCGVVCESYRTALVHCRRKRA